MQWQVSTDDGATFTDIAGVMDTTLIFAAALVDNHKQFRAISPTPPARVLTTAATLTVLPVMPSEVVSRKLHNGTPFDINLPLTGSVGVECRSGGASNDYQIVFTFPSAVTFTSAAVTSGAGNVGRSSGSGTTTATVNLTDVTNAQRITVRLISVNNLGDVSAPMGILIGDSGGDRLVNSGDATQTRGRSGQTVDATTFRSDFNVDGMINGGDVIIARTRSGAALP